MRSSYNLQYVLEAEQTKHVYKVIIASEREDSLIGVHILPSQVDESVCSKR